MFSRWLVDLHGGPAGVLLRTRWVDQECDAVSPALGNLDFSDDSQVSARHTPVKVLTSAGAVKRASPLQASISLKQLMMMLAIQLLLRS
jgi:hypothetical protein